MRKEWIIIDFEKCLEKVSYTNKIKTKEFKTEGRYPIVSQEKELINGFWANQEDVFHIDTPVVIFGDHTQVVKFIDFDFVLGADGVKILKPKKEIDPKYFYYFLKNIDFESLGYARHYRLLKDVKVTFPESLPEQQRIASILDRCFEAIDRARAIAEQNLKNARKLFESYLRGVFEDRSEEWEERRLEEIVDKNCTLSYGIVQPGGDYPNGLAIVRPTDLTQKYITTENLKRINPELAEGYKRTKLGGSELLLCVRGTTGVISIATKELEGANVTRGIVPVRFDSNIMIQNFGYFCLISKFVQDQIQAKTYGAALMQINIGDLRKILIRYPKSIDIQEITVKKLEEILSKTETSINLYKKKKDNLEELKKSILQKAFAGEL